MDRIKFCLAQVDPQGRKTSGSIRKYTTKDSAGYIFIKVKYKENLGRELIGQVTFIGASKEIDLNEGDQVPVLYSNEKPDSHKRFLLSFHSVPPAPL